MNITNEQFNELLLAGLRQIASDARQLSSGNIAHRAAQIRANALQLIDITTEVNQQKTTDGVQQQKQAAANAGSN